MIDYSFVIHIRPNALIDVPNMLPTLRVKVCKCLLGFTETHLQAQDKINKKDSRNSCKGFRRGGNMILVSMLASTER